MIKYPYTDFHEMNLDWILAKIKELEKLRESIGNLEELKTQIKDNLVHAINEIADRLIIIATDIDAINRIANDAQDRSLANADHIGRFEDLIQDFNSLVDAINKLLRDVENINTDMDAINTTANNADERSLVNAEHIGNIEDLTIEHSNLVSAVNKAYSDINSLRQNLMKLFTQIIGLENKIGNLNNLITANKDNLVNALNEVKTEQGNLSNLQTFVNTTIVDAVNEVNGKTNDVIGDLETTNTNIGDLLNLETSDKNSIVNAVNEINKQCYGINVTKNGDWTIPNVTSDTANSALTAFDYTLPTDLQEEYRVTGIISLEAFDGNTRLNVVPVSSFTMANETQMRLRILVCGGTSKHVTKVSYKVLVEKR